MQAFPTYYYEKQKIRQWWIWTIMAGSFALVVCVFGYGLISQLILGKAIGSKPISNTGLVALSVFNISLMLSSLVLLHKVALTVEVTEKALSVSFFFLMPLKKISLHDISGYRVRHFNAFNEFGGYGFKGSTARRTVIMSGNSGIEISLKNGNTLLLGSRRSDDFCKTLEYLLSNNI